MLSCIGFAVGLGNVWRFPYLCYRNGGGAFLIPYCIMLVICGLPLFFFELAMGQFASEGPITVWKVNPIFYGVGWGMVCVSGLVCIYYNVIIMYSVYYMFVSFISLDTEVPWKTCDNPWNTRRCRNESYPAFDSMTNETEKVMTRLNMMDLDCVDSKLAKASYGSAMAAGYSVLTNWTECHLDLDSGSEEFWTRYVLRLHESDGLDNIGDISLKNVICLFFTWILIFFCLIKGIKSSGKVVYFTATFPYVILIVLLVRGLTLPGYKDGIHFYITPDIDKLSDPKVWSDAATQIFYSLGVGFGGLQTMSSYNAFKNNCWRDSLIVAFINCGTSVFAGFAIFSLLGFMAYQTNQNVADVADSGPGLAFVAYPEGLSQLPVSSLWAFLFFFMILTLGLDSQFVMMETVISGITDMYPRILNKRKMLFTFVCCIIGFLLGIPMTCKGGIYILTLFDWYSGSYNLMILCVLELIAVCYIYGIRRFVKDVEMMIGPCNFIFWAYYLINWMLITPGAVLFIIISSGINYTPAYYGMYVFPAWAEGVGWFLAMLPVALVVVAAIYSSFKYGLPTAFKPRPDWGPRLAVNRTGMYNDNLGYVAEGDELPTKDPVSNGTQYTVKL